MRQLQCHECGGICCTPPAMNQNDAAIITAHTAMRLEEVDNDFFMFENSWHDDGSLIEKCPVFNHNSRSCLIYQYRPTICRLFGQDRRLPCIHDNPKKIKYYQSWQAFYIIQRLIKKGK